jgi:hypothetical protein
MRTIVGIEQTDRAAARGRPLAARALTRRGVATRRGVPGAAARR